MTPAVQFDFVMEEPAVLEDAHRLVTAVLRTNLASPPLVTSVARHSQGRRSGPPARPAPLWISWAFIATAARLRFQERLNISELVSDGCPVDSPERAANIQSPFVLEHFHAAPADGGVHMLIYPRPRNRRNPCQIHNLRKLAHRPAPSCLTPRPETSICSLLVTR